jgi:xylitol oxidase
LDDAEGTVTVGAGTRYGELAPWLEERGRALHNLGSLPHISIGGATQAGTHGSGVGNGTLSSAVAALEYVGGDGEIHTEARGDDGFEALVVGLGAFGIMTRVTLDTVPSYRMRQFVYSGLPWEALLVDPLQVLGAAYSVSVFTQWDEPTVEQVWVKQRLDGATDLPARWFGAARIEPGATTTLAGGDPSALTPHTGQEAAWFEILPHFKLAFTPSNGDEIQTEYFVPLADAAAAIEAIRAMRSWIAPLLLVTELRTVAADEAWLSGSHGRDTLAIHFTWKPMMPEVRALLPHLEAALAPYLPRPHWGKVTRMGHAQVGAANPRLADARREFERRDPDRRFSNEFLARFGLR